MIDSMRRARVRRALAVVVAVAGGVPAVVGAAPAEPAVTGAEPAERPRVVAAGHAQWVGDVRAEPPAVSGPDGVTLPAKDGIATEANVDLRLTGGLTLRLESATAGDPAAAENVDDHADGDSDGQTARDVRLTRIEVHVSGHEGVVVADVASREVSEGDSADPEGAAEYTAVVLGALDLTGHPLAVGDGAVSATDVPVTLTAAGAAAVAGDPLPDGAAGASADIPADESPTAADADPGAVGQSPAAADADDDAAGLRLPALSLELELGPPAEAPTVEHQPADVTVPAGEDAVFTAEVTGLPTPDLQWQVHTPADPQWRDVPGATGPQLVLPTVRVAQDGTRVRVVASSLGAPPVTTDPATLTVVAPTLEVFAADGVTRVDRVAYGDTVVVRGTGFGARPDTGSAPDGRAHGTVVAFGRLAEQWRPSEGAPSGARVAGTELRAVPADALASGDEPRRTVELRPDGTFTAELEISAPAYGWPEDGTFAVYTYAPGATADPDRELAAPLRLVSRPAIEVHAADGVTPVADTQVQAGDTVVVRGTGFDPTRTDGTTVAFGRFPDVWQPSKGVPPSMRAVGSQVVVTPGAGAAGDDAGAAPDADASARSVDASAGVHASDGAGLSVGTTAAPMSDATDAPVGENPAQVSDASDTTAAPDSPTVALDGSFTVALTVIEPPAAPATDLSGDGVTGIYTYAAGEEPDPARELAVPVDVAVPEPLPGLPPMLAPEPVPAAPADSTPALLGPVAEPTAEPQPDEPAPPATEPAREVTVPAVPTSDAAPGETSASAQNRPAAAPAVGSSALVVLVIIALVAGALVRGLRGD